MSARGSASERVFGLDGCRAGWVGVLVEDGVVSAKSYASFDEILHESANAVAIDVPIGLPDARIPGGRECDRLARAALGPRRASVFNPPLRAHLSAQVRPSDLSIQSWNIVPKIREVDAAMTPRLQRRIRESHPEVAFARISGAPMRFAKRAPAGRAERWRALGPTFRAARKWPRPRGVAEDDVLDAAALAVVAQRATRGEAIRLPERPGRDARGLAMEIVA